MSSRRWLCPPRALDPGPAHLLCLCGHACVVVVAAAAAMFAGSTHSHPVKGCLLIYNEGGHFEHTGHVAIITEATDKYVVGWGVCVCGVCIGRSGLWPP